MADHGDGLPGAATTIVALLALLCLLLILYAREKLDSRREDALWEARRLRLHALNKRKPSRSHFADLEHKLFFGDPDAFAFHPGAVWIVEDPRDVMLSPAG